MQNNPSRKKFFFLIRLCLSCAIFAYLISLIDFERLLFVISRLHIEYTWQAFFLLLLTNLCVSIRWSMLLHHFHIKQSIYDSWRYYMIGGFYSIILPGAIGGDIVRLGLSCKQHSNRKTLLTSSIFFERSCGIMVIMIIATVSMMLFPVVLSQERAIAHLLPVFALTTLTLFMLSFLILKTSPPRWFENTDTFNIFKQKILTLLGNFRNLPIRMLLLFLLMSTLAHFFDILGSFYLARALQIEQPFTMFLLIMPLVYILTILPISIGGIGVREGVLTFFLVKVDVLASDAVLLSFAIYVNRILVGLIGCFFQINNIRQQA